MSYCLTIHCGCIVYVSCHPETGVAHTRIVQSRGRACRRRRHEVGLHLYLWELLPEAPSLSTQMTADDIERTLARARPSS